MSILYKNDRNVRSVNLGRTRVNIGKNSQLGKHGFGSLHNLNWPCYLNEDILLRRWLRFINEVDQISLNSLLRFFFQKMSIFSNILFPPTWVKSDYIEYIYYVSVRMEKSSQSCRRKTNVKPRKWVSRVTNKLTWRVSDYVTLRSTNSRSTYWCWWQNGLCSISKHINTEQENQNQT